MEVAKSWPVRYGNRLLISSIVLAALAIGSLFWIKSQAPGSGPLASDDPKGSFTSTGLPVERPHEVFTYAQFALENHGDQSAVVDDVELIAPPSGMKVRLLQSFIAHQSSSSPVFPEVPGWPEKWYRHIRSAKGSLVPVNGKGKYTLALVVRAPPGFHRASRNQFAVAEGIKVYYHVGSRHYVDTWPTQIVLCHGSCTRFSKKQWPDPPDVS